MIGKISAARWAVLLPLVAMSGMAVAQSTPTPAPCPVSCRNGLGSGHPAAARRAERPGEAGHR